MWFATACAATAAAAPVAALFHAKRRLRRSAERADAAVAELPREEDPEAFHAAAQQLGVVDFPPAKTLRARYADLAAKTSDDAAFAAAVARVACGERCRRLGVAAELCADASETRTRLERAAASVAAAARYADAERSALEARDVVARCERTLPAAFELPWRAEWQADEKARDAARLVAVCRERFSHDALETSPLATACAELEFVASAAADALEALGGGGDDLRKRLARTLDRADRAARAVRAAPEYWDERRSEGRLLQLRRAADAAEASAAEQAKLRKAAEDRVAVAEACRAAIARVEAALRAETAPGPLGPPTTLGVCRNDVDPISLEALRNYELRDLRLLPSGNCAHADLLKKMLRRVDPFTNVPLPSDRRAAGDVDAVLAAARRACGA